ncbi:hypothetical protein [Synechococcus sp. 1G10]|uniref:hypothetical protein n=1 Tax=Synechococcus sp. 1G10 TaxID=2025605 RepID=UPI000B9993EE|nr:hypothetical protein [Synechococcus sp. 1G10]
MSSQPLRGPVGLLLHGFSGSTATFSALEPALIQLGLVVQVPIEALLSFLQLNVMVCGRCGHELFRDGEQGAVIATVLQFVHERISRRPVAP